MNLQKLAERYRVDKPEKFRLKDVDPGDTGKIKSKEESQELLQEGVARLAKLQDMLYAQNHWSLLLIFQAMDAAGKDGTIKHVFSGVNPQGCQVWSFKKPSTEELDHDFLWRSTRCLPERGRIGIHNRSHYEEVLVVRVHPELLAAQHLPPERLSADLWEQRYKDINNFERYLDRNGTIVLKFFLHVSRAEQRKRLLARLDAPEKNWKFEIADAKERTHWKEYMEAYEDAIRATSTKHAPWYVVPADNKWFTRIVVSGAIDGALEDLQLHYPAVTDEKRKELLKVRGIIQAQK